MVEKLAITINCHKLQSKFSRNITVSTNDPSKAQVTLVCKGHILEPLSMVPKTLSFGQVSRKNPDSMSKKVTITRGDGGPLKLILKPLQNPELHASLREIEPGEKYELEVCLVPPLRTPSIQANLEFETGLEQAPTASVPIYGTVVPRVAAMPQNILVPQVRSAEWEQRITLNWDDEETHHITEVTADIEGLDVELLDDDGEQEILVRVPPEFKIESGSRSISIHTDDTEVPVLPVTVQMATSRTTRPSRRPRPATTQPAGAATTRPAGAGTVPPAGPAVPEPVSSPPE